MAGTGREEYHRGLANNVSLNGSELPFMTVVHIYAGIQTITSVVERIG